MPRSRKQTPKAAKPAPLSPAALLAAFEPVRRAAVGLPEVEEGTWYRTPSLRVRGKSFTRLREDGETLVVLVDFDSRDSMLRLQPEVFYLTDHYRNYPAVLIRLSAIRRPQLREVLADSWRRVAPRTLVARPEGR
jgi:hypothetical protein